MMEFIIQYCEKCKSLSVAKSTQCHKCFSYRKPIKVIVNDISKDEVICSQVELEKISNEVLEKISNEKPGKEPENDKKISELEKISEDNELNQLIEKIGKNKVYEILKGYMSLMDSVPNEISNLVYAVRETFELTGSITKTHEIAERLIVKYRNILIKYGILSATDLIRVAKL